MVDIGCIVYVIMYIDVLKWEFDVIGGVYGCVFLL